ncbi:MAG: zinc-dependent peptidase [Bacteroidota bacterium]|nr:zinc-dependent peptidase [Bacteroidota bacterium]
MFNDKFETSGPDRRILGMVGTGYMDGKMVLSKPALHHGFVNESDKKNTAIHEFVHLIDKFDGSGDGVPALLLEKQYVIPWLDLINKKIEEIFDNESDINPYGGTNRQEFFAVASEYFFERPKLLVRKHPVLYNLLEIIFNQDMTARDLNKKKLSIGRNSPCPCNSGLKFKKCCGKEHYKKSMIKAPMKQLKLMLHRG